MPLDRHASRILQMLSAAAATGQEYTPESVRKSMVELAQAFDPRDLPAVETQDHVLQGPGGPLLLRQYLPATVGQPAALGPALLYLHGGVGVFGSVRTHDAVCRMLCADASLPVFSLEYRLAPEHPFPSAHEDAWFAACALQAHGARWGVDPSRLAIGGDSAGATLAAYVTQRARDQRDGPLGFAAQLLLCPVTDLPSAIAGIPATGPAQFPSDALLQWALSQVLGPGVDPADPRLSPLRAAQLAGLPAAVIHTAEFDRFREGGEAYARALDAAGVPVMYACHAGLIHHYYGMAGAIPAARAALRQAATELRATIDAPGD